MDKEVNKMGLKRKSKPLFDSDDDEPIGTLLKLKSKRNSKKGKVVVEDGGNRVKGAKKLAVEDEELGGMDDTLANFRKKLRGPKRDSGSVVVVGKNLGRNVKESSCEPLNETVKDGDSDPVSRPEVQSMSLESNGGGCSGDETVVEGLKVKVNREIKASKVKSDAEMVGKKGNCDDCSDLMGSENDALRQELKGASELGNGSLEDSLSSFVQKVQLGMIRKSRSSSKLKQGKVTLASDGSKPNPVVASDPSFGRCQSVSKLVNKFVMPKDSSHRAPGQGSIKSNLISHTVGDHLSEFINRTPSDSVCTDSRQGLSSNVLEWSGSDNRDDSSKGIPGNSASISFVQRSPSSLKACSGKITGVQDCEVNSEASTDQRDSTNEVANSKKLDGTCEVSHCADTKDNCLLSPQEPIVAANYDKEHLDPQLNVNTTILPHISKNICSSVVEEYSENKLSIKKCEDASASSPNSMSGRNLELSASVSKCRENISYDVKMNNGLHADLHGIDLERLQRHLSPTTPDSLPKEHTSGDGDSPVRITGSTGERDVASVSSLGEDDQVSEYRISPESAFENLNYEVTLRTKHENKLQKVVDESGPVLGSSHELLEVSCPTNSDYLCRDEEVNGTSCTSIMLGQGSCPDDRESPDDPETKDGLSVLQRAARNAKKRRHGDMAYEGDADWDTVMHGQEFFVSHPTKDKTRENRFVDAENGKAAAVSAGLKARAVGPIEKIKFKEVLKRKGGVQEYLELRNQILKVWNRDVSRILRLADFGVPNSPVVGESPHDSLLRDIYFFLDQRGYINFGVPSEKEKGEKYVKHDVKLLKEEKFGENSGLPVADTEDGVSFIVGKEKRLETCVEGNNNDAFSDGKPEGNLKKEDNVNLLSLEASGPSIPEGCAPDAPDESQEICLDKMVVAAECLGSIPSCKDNEGEEVLSVPSDLLPHGELMSSLPSKLPKSGSALSATMDCEHSCTSSDSEPKKSIIVVGAGPAGLTAARHLQRQGFCVTVLEARSRIGGRVFTDHSSLSVPVDLGASIITGVEADVDTERRPDPSSLICAQLGIELTVLNSDCPLYDTVTGQKVPADLDEALEAEYNSLIDDMVLVVAEKGERAMKMSLEEGLEYGLKRRRMSSSEEDDMKVLAVKSINASVAAGKYAKDDEVSDVHGSKAGGLTPLERRIMDWHFAHLEYGCAALLKEVSLPNWNQDDVYGGFGGAHCMIKGGYSSVLESLGEGINIRLEHVVTDIKYCPKDCRTNNDLVSKVTVLTSNGMEFSGDAVLVTVPLGCLKAETIKFSPHLPQWKYLSINRLGFGILNKLVLEFAEVFWDESIDYFGATAEDTDQRGRCFMFWNLKKTVGAPVLIALVVGKAAIEGQNISPADQVSHALLVLRKLFGEGTVSDPVASVVTDWGRDPYSYGAYSYVAVGSSGEDYDILGRPVEDCVFFAGEATCKEHPDTVGGAMMSGLREAVRIIDILRTGTDFTAEVEAMEAARRHSDIERSEVKDIIRRLNAVEFSSFMYKNSLDRSQISSWGSMLKDMFFTARTTAGRLHLVKELLNLPVGFLRTFASTKKGLSILNSWILDSMGKDGTQLLRHCVRLLVLVSNDLLAVRVSGVGKTIKEKVCVHTSRDIRAIASQLVNVWVELYRKEKASRGGLKSVKQSSALDSKSKFGKPPLRTHHVAPESKGNSKVSASAEHQLPSNANTMKVINKSVKPETRNDPKSDVQLANSHGSNGCGNIMEESHEIPMSEEEKAAFAAAEAARAAAIAAAKAYSSSGAMRNTLPQVPKILSFHKFAMREQCVNMDESDSRKHWSGAVIGRQDCLSEIDSRNCRVRDWSVDFSAAGVNLENSKLSIDDRSQRSHSNEVASQLNFREHSGESVAVDSSILTKAWVDSAGSMGIKDYNAIERWQCQAAAASSGFSHGTMHLTDEEDSNMSSKLHNRKHDAPANESSASQVTTNKESKTNHSRGPDRIKQSVVDYVASLLMPLYKARKIDKEGYKSIMKKTATKVMEQTSDAEKAMAVYEFLDFKRKNKIRAFVDMLIERHMRMKPDARSGSSEKD